MAAFDVGPAGLGGNIADGTLSGEAPGGEIRIERSGSAWNPVYPGLIKIFLMLVLGVMTVQFAILAVNYARGRR